MSLGLSKSITPILKQFGPNGIHITSQAFCTIWLNVCSMNQISKSESKT